jgi:hypothetical protein
MNHKMNGKMKNLLDKLNIILAFFDVKNTVKHAFSTLLGLFLGFVLLALVLNKQATFQEISPFLLIVIPFLLYGNKGKEPPNVV